MTLYLDIHVSSSAAATAKPVLILVHGGALSHRMFKDMLPFLTGSDVVGVDLPGHGDSTSLGPFSISRAGDLLHETFQQLRTQDPRWQPRQWVAVGVSLGGQVVLDWLRKHPQDSVDTAVVSGVSIGPPDDLATWEMPHMPTSEAWMAIIMDDVKRIGRIEAAQPLQEASLAFTFSPPSSAMPPILVVIGEMDVPMAKRDFPELARVAKSSNPRSKGLILENAWHNHPIDVPEQFADAVLDWTESILPHTDEQILQKQP